MGGKTKKKRRRSQAKYEPDVETERVMKVHGPEASLENIAQKEKNGMNNQENPLISEITATNSAGNPNLESVKNSDPEINRTDSSTSSRRCKIVTAVLVIIMLLVLAGAFILRDGALITILYSWFESSEEKSYSNQTTTEETKNVQNFTTEEHYTTTTMPTTTPAVLIERNSLGVYDSRTVFKYTMTNKKDMSVEVLSLGARLNRLVGGGIPMIKGLDASNLTGLADDLTGAWHGPVCGKSPNLHKQHFEGATTANGSLQLTATVNGVLLIFLYTLDNGNKLTVEITGTPGMNVTTQMDICSSKMFNLNPYGTGNIAISHLLEVNAEQSYDPSGTWTNLSGGYKDFRNLSAVYEPITRTKTVISPSLPVLKYIYRLKDLSGVSYAATIDSNATAPKLEIETNQNVLSVAFNLVTVDSIRLMFKSHPQNTGEPDGEKITLGHDSIYEFVITYTIV